jgi:acetyltransferase-like isoleucine patch superfamily enzyme
MLQLNPKYLQRLLRALPNVFWPIKYLIIKKSLKATGKKLRFGSDSFFSDHRLIEIGNNVFMGYRTTISTNVPVIIGDNVMFGPEVMIIGGDHSFKNPGELMRNVKTGGINLPIEIENDVWVGARCLILKGVKISEGAVIGAGSLVTKLVLPYSINLGHPSYCVRCRFNMEELSFHLQNVKSKYTVVDIKKIYLRENIELN